MHNLQNAFIAYYTIKVAYIVVALLLWRVLLIRILVLKRFLFRLLYLRRLFIYNRCFCRLIKAWHAWSNVNIHGLQHFFTRKFLAAEVTAATTGGATFLGLRRRIFLSG